MDEYLQIFYLILTEKVSKRKRRKRKTGIFGVLFSGYYSDSWFILPRRTVKGLLPTDARPPRQSFESPDFLGAIQMFFFLQKQSRSNHFIIYL